MSNIQTALLLMTVGMVTVFTILLIIMGLGKALIAFVNKFVPEEEAPAKKAQGPAPIPSNVLAAISAAVTVVTHGKGKVSKVEKI